MMAVTRHAGLIAGRKALLLPGDIGLSGVCEEITRQTLEAFGKVDILVNNAAFQRTYENFQDIPDAEFEETFRVNVFAMFRLCKLLLPPQMEPGSSIINTASIQSFDPSENLIAYAATKAAIASFTRSLAAHAIERGVRVNAVAPRPIWNPLIPATMPKRGSEKLWIDLGVQAPRPASRSRASFRVSGQCRSELCYGRSLRRDRRSDADLNLRRSV